MIGFLPCYYSRLLPFVSSFRQQEKPGEMTRGGGGPQREQRQQTTTFLLAPPNRNHAAVRQLSLLLLLSFDHVVLFASL